MNEVSFQDTPLVDIGKDELGRGPLVELIVNSIRKLSSTKDPCTVYGIYGKWAEGMASFMNWYCYKAEHDPTRVEMFNILFHSASK